MVSSQIQALQIPALPVALNAQLVQEVRPRVLAMHVKQITISTTMHVSVLVPIVPIPSTGNVYRSALVVTRDQLDQFQPVLCVQQLLVPTHSLFPPKLSTEGIILSIKLIFPMD